MTSRLAAKFPWTSSLARFLWPARQARRKRWIILLLSILLLVAAHTLWVTVASRRLMTVSDRLSESWGPMSPSTLAPPEVPDDVNAAKPVRAAGEMLAMPDQIVGVDRSAAPRQFGAFRSPEPGAGALAALRQVVADNDLTFAILDEAAKRPRANWDLRYQAGIQVQLPDLMQVLDLAKLNITAGRLALRTGDVEGVLRALERGAAIERSLAPEPLLIIQMIRGHVQRLRVALLREWLGTGPVSEMDLARALEMQAESGSDFSLAASFVGEAKAMLDVMLESTDHGLAPWSDVGGDGVIVGSLSVLIKPVMIDNLRVYLEVMDPAVQCAEQPRSRRTPGCADGMETDDLGAYFTIVRTMVANLSAMLDQADMAVARHRLATAALALEDHRLRHGAYPEGLGELGDLLEEAGAAASHPESWLEDPFTGSLLQYEREGSGYRLASQGPGERSLSGGLPDPILNWRMGS